MGIMAVAPDPVLGQPGVTVPGVQGSRPPGPSFGGNLDVKDLTAGTTVYLPVFQPGALFYVGDGHGAQGDGEVSGTAIEQVADGHLPSFGGEGAVDHRPDGRGRRTTTS